MRHQPRALSNPIRKLASQTAIYGISSIVGRFLNYLLVPLYTRCFSTGEYGLVSEFYAYSGFFAVLLTFGMETGYFRFTKTEDSKKVYATALNFLLIASVLFVGAIVLFSHPIASLLQHPTHPEYAIWFAVFLGMDAVCAIPFARLRNEDKAFRFAGIKMAEIAVNIGLNFFFIVYCKREFDANSQSWVSSVYFPAIGIGYVFIANLAASVFKMILLLPQFTDIIEWIDRELLRKLIRYSLPMVVIGFAGVINEMLDRVVLKYLLPFDPEVNLQQLGIYAACYKLSIVMSLFIQAFRFAAEPFFFAHANKSDSKKIYADVMNYFVIFCCFIFLAVTLYLNFFQHFIGVAFREGLFVVPILLMANLCLGIYINLSIWYKLTDQTMLGAYVSIGGAVLTIVLNILLIPTMGYAGAAWATLACYGAMAVVSYLLGQKYYPVPYNLAKVFGYIALSLLLYSFYIHHQMFVLLPHYIIGTSLLLFYLAVVWFFEGRRRVSVEIQEE